MKIKNKNKEISPNWKKLCVEKNLLKKNINNNVKKIGNNNQNVFKNKNKSQYLKKKRMKTNDNENNNDNYNNTNNNNNDKINKKPNIWFDDVDPELIRSTQLPSNSSLCLEKSTKKLTNTVAMDCEMVGIGYGGLNSALARVSIVNLYGHCVYDKFVKPMEEITDYRTPVSGIRPEHLENAVDFKIVQQEVNDIIDGRILVGHSIHYDLSVLYLSHPKHMIRDTSIFFKKFFHGRTPSLKRLSNIYLNVTIQDGEHDSIVDAQATMRLYTLYKKQWESQIRLKIKRKEKRNSKKINNNNNNDNNQ